MGILTWKPYNEDYRVLDASHYGIGQFTIVDGPADENAAGGGPKWVKLLAGNALAMTMMVKKVKLQLQQQHRPQHLLT